MGRQPGFFDVDERLRELSAKGDDLERISGLVDFEMFRAGLVRAVPRSDGSKGGRPAFDHVLMFKVLLLQAMHTLSDERCEYLIRDRLSFMRFLRLGLTDPVPDANTIWTFREALKRADVVDALFQRFDGALRTTGYLAMSGQIVDATIVAAPKQRNTVAERGAMRCGGSWVAPVSGGALFCCVGPLDAISERDAGDDFWQLVFALQPAPGF